MNNLAMKQWHHRQAVKNPPTPKYELRQTDILKIVNDAIIEDRKKTVNRLYAVFALTLHDEHGFGKERLQKVLKKTASHFECVMQGYVTEEEIMKEVEKFDIFIK